MSKVHKCMQKKSKITMPKKYNRVNIAGLNIKRIRTERFPNLSQNGLAAKLQLQGIAITKNTIQRMEAGLCGINDIQLVAIAQILKTSVTELLDESAYQVEFATQTDFEVNVAE